jgi:hypothetical protein
MKKCLTLLVMGFITPSHAASVLENQISHCQSITADEQRLACFDLIKVTADTTIAGHAAPTVTPAVPPVAPVVAAADFGIEHKKKKSKEQQDKIVLTLTKLSKTLRGELIFTFENGQVWRQTTSEIFIASEGERYILRRGVLNSFFVGKEGYSRQTRVRREK